MSEHAVPTEWDVLQTLKSCPDVMINDCAREAVKRLTHKEACYILAAYELQRPRVVKAIISDGVVARDSV